MPPDKAHLEQTQKNISFLEDFVDSNKFNDWAITVAFYTCVHIAEFLFFAKKNLTYKGITIQIEHSDDLPVAAMKANIPPPNNMTWTAKQLNHKFRNTLLTENFPEISQQHYYLYNKSRQARYYCYKWDKLDIDLDLKYSITHIIKWVNQNFKADLKVTKSVLKA